MSKHSSVIKNSFANHKEYEDKIAGNKNIWLFANFVPIHWLYQKEKVQRQLSLGICKGIIKPSEYYLNMKQIS